MERYVAGIDIGGTTVKMAVFTLEGDMVDKWEIPTDKTGGGEHIIRDIGASMKKQLDSLGIPYEALQSAGVGAPGPVDVENGLLFEAVNLGWKDRYPLRDLVKDALQIPTAIDNDANCAALGEMWKGAGKGAGDLICITLGTGVGGGIIVNGDIVHGAKGAAGEIGHMTAVPEGGYLCNCGKTGCLETVASATGLVRMAMDNIKAWNGASFLKEKVEKAGVISAKDVFEAASMGDEPAASTIDQLALQLGLALANAGSILNPEKIVLGGGVSKAGDLVLSPVKQYFRKFAFKPVGESTEIVVAELENDAGVTGAAWLAVNKI
ncbi:MAG TPA: ROK family glucokinase [Bacillaceae bacterium]